MTVPLQITHDRQFLRRFTTRDRVRYLTEDDVALLRKACEAGDPYAQYGYGRWLYYLNPFDDAMRRTEELYLTCQSLIPDAMAAYGQMIRFGETVITFPNTMDIDESNRHIELAARRGSELGALLLARHRIFGHHREAEPQVVAEEIEKRLAEERDPDPQWYIVLGYAYQELERTDEAISYYEKAIDMGSADDCILLAGIYSQRGNHALCEEIMEEGCRKGLISCLAYQADMSEETFQALSEEEQQQLHQDLDERLHRGIRMGDGCCAYWLWRTIYYGGLGYEEDEEKSYPYLLEGIRLSDTDCITNMANLAKNHLLPADLQPSPTETCELWLRAARLSLNDEDALYGLKYSNDPEFLLRHKEELERYWRPLWEKHFPTPPPSDNVRPAKQPKTPIDPMVIVIWPSGHLDVEKADVYKMRSYREMGQALIGADGLDGVHYSPLLQAVAKAAELEQDLVMYVDRDAQMKDLADNAIGSLLYGHGEVRGPIIVCLQDKRHDCHSFTTLEDLVGTYNQIDQHCGGLLIVKDEDDGRWDPYV